jgi:CheY-like chemotaxis protein
MKPLKQSELLNTILDLLSANHAGGSGGGPDRIASGVGRTSDALPTKKGQRKLHVLLAEDNNVNQRLAMRLLEKQGHRVTLAINGQQAVEAVARERFDLVLMDVQMPELGGFEATAQVRAAEQGTGRHVPIVALTAHAMKGDRERCLAAGMDAYVAKPIQAQELFETMEEVLRRLGAPVEDRPRPPAPAPLPVDEFDRAAAMERVGEDLELFHELVEMFLAESPAWFAALVAAIKAGDAPGVKRTAHTIKGAVSTFAAQRAWDAALCLETMGREGNLREAKTGLAELREALQRLEGALRAEK